MTPETPEIKQFPGIISKEQAYKGGVVAAIVIITIICAYVLWALLSTDSFLPYSGNALVPQTINILAFIGLFTLIVSGVSTLLVTTGYIVYRYIVKRVVEFDEKIVITIYITAVLFFFVTLLLHVFNIVNFIVSLLCFVTFWGIVAYVQVRKKHRFQKYVPKSDRRAKGSDSVEIPGKQS